MILHEKKWTQFCMAFQRNHTILFVSTKEKETFKFNRINQIFFVSTKEKETLI